MLLSALEGRKNLISGANNKDHHIKNITPGQSFVPTAYADLCAVECRGSLPDRCSADRHTAVEIGDISSWATSIQKSTRTCVLDRNGKEVMPIMGLLMASELSAFSPPRSSKKQ